MNDFLMIWAQSYTQFATSAMLAEKNLQSDIP
jgi:hypothetical protein